MTAATWQSAVRPLAAGILDQHGLPGLVIAVARGRRPPEYLAIGADGDGRALGADSLFAVASITKLATALAVLRLVAAEVLALDDPLGRHLPDARSAQPGVTVRALLRHTSGLPHDLAPGAASYAPGLDWPALARGCLATPLAIRPGARVLYSNTGLGLLAIVVERATGRPFPLALAGQVLAPLGIEAYLGAEPPRPPVRLAGKAGRYTGTPLEPYNTPFWRSLALPWGGLVTTAAGAIALVRAFAGQSPGFLPPDVLREATRNQAGGLSGGLFKPLTWSPCPWGLGIELRGQKTPHWTPGEASPASYGHAGASGCLAWHDPAAEVSWAILGTRGFDTWWQTWPAIGAAILAAGQ